MKNSVSRWLGPDVWQQLHLVVWLPPSNKRLELSAVGKRVAKKEQTFLYYCEDLFGHEHVLNHKTLM